MKSYLAVTDPEWFLFHKGRKSSEVIFWKPTTKTMNFPPEMALYFLVKGTPRKVSGKGTFAMKGISPIERIWSDFGKMIGHNSLEEWLMEMNTKRGSEGGLNPYTSIAYYKLTDIIYFDNPIPPKSFHIKSVGKKIKTEIFPGHIEFSHAIVSGKYISQEQSEEIKRIVDL
jgi:hypothetical protein